ncbi:MAG: (2Fe-2S) ferredoxin domain-containing protein [Cyanobacteria bacterium J06627_8]
MEHNFKNQFSLEGRFSGFVPHKKKPFKYLRLTTQDNEYCIKLPKYLQLQVVSGLDVGTWVQIRGTWKTKSDGSIRLKAEDLKGVEPSAHQSNGFLTYAQGVGNLLPKTDALENHQLSAKEKISSSGKASSSEKTVKILVCGKSKCMKKGGQTVCQQLEALVTEYDLDNRVTIKQTGCMDRCKAGPNLVVMPDKARYSNVQPSEIAALLERHV